MAVPDGRWKSQQKTGLAKHVRLEALDRQFQDLARTDDFRALPVQKAVCNSAAKVKVAPADSGTPNVVNVGEEYHDAEGIPVARKRAAASGRRKQQN